MREEDRAVEVDEVHELSTTDGPRATAACDVYDNDESYLLVADLPGVAPEDLDMEVKGQSLQIAGTHRGVTTERRFQLPQNVDVDGIEASMDRGVLHVRIPKAASAQRRRIEVIES